jgi:hypothetical protein
VSGTSEVPTSSRSRGLALGVAAVVAVGLVVAYGSATGATEPLALEVVSVDETGTAQDVPDTVVPAISDTGAVVVYESVESSRTRVWIRDKVGDTSRPVAELDSLAPAVSGNGCTVAYVVLAADRSEAQLTAVDRCATAGDLPLPVGAVLDTIALDPSPTPSVATPAVSFDGSVIVWSTGREIRRYGRPTVDAPYAPTHSFDVTAPASPDVVTGEGVDVSADGSTIVYAAGPGREAFDPATANVYVWTLGHPDPRLLSSTAAGGPAAFDSSTPNISADGDFVVFESTATDLAAVGSATVATPFVVGVDLGAGTTQVLVDDASLPALAADGEHVAYQRAGAIRVLSSVDGTVTDVAPIELDAADPTGRIAISQHGRWLVFGSAVDLSAEPTPPTSGLPAVWAADRSASESVVVDTTTTTTTIPTTTIPTTTTTPETATSSTAPATTAAPTTVSPTVPRFPPSSFPRSTLPRSRSTPFSSSSGPFPRALLTASAAPVTFEPTVAGVGRRAQPVTLYNTTVRTVGVTSVAVDPSETFLITTDGCSGLRLAPGGSCSIEVQFAPTDVGVVTGVATYGLDDGSVVTAVLDGKGVPEPTLDFVPDVAGAGQTVTVFGAGFPSGITVELAQPGVALPHPVIVDPDGTFAQVIVILPNTPTGPMSLSVAGQPDVFSDVGAELLVSSRGANSDGAALLSSPTRR